MFEAIWWFIFKDSRVELPLVKTYTTQVLITTTAVNLALATLFLVLWGFEARETTTTKLLFYFKFVWEIINAVIFMPYLIYKSSQRHVFSDDRPRERYDLKLYLQSRILERSLGSSINGLEMLFFGCFNMCWSLMTISDTHRFRFSKWPYAILMLFVVVDLAAFSIAVVFAVVVIIAKMRGIYTGTINLKKIIRKKIELH